MNNLTIPETILRADMVKYLTDNGFEIAWVENEENICRFVKGDKFVDVEAGEIKLWELDNVQFLSCLKDFEHFKKELHKKEFIALHIPEHERLKTRLIELREAAKKQYERPDMFNIRDYIRGKYDAYDLAIKNLEEIFEGKDIDFGI